MFHQKILFVCRDSQGDLYRVAFLPFEGKAKFSMMHNGRTIWRDTKSLGDPGMKELFSALIGGFSADVSRQQATV